MRPRWSSASSTELLHVLADDALRAGERGDEADLQLLLGERRSGREKRGEGPDEQGAERDTHGSTSSIAGARPDLRRARPLEPVTLTGTREPESRAGAVYQGRAPECLRFTPPSRGARPRRRAPGGPFRTAGSAARPRPNRRTARTPSAGPRRCSRAARRCDGRGRRSRSSTTRTRRSSLAAACARRRGTGCRLPAAEASAGGAAAAGRCRPPSGRRASSVPLSQSSRWALPRNCQKNSSYGSSWKSVRSFGPPTTVTMKSVSCQTCWLPTGGLRRCACSSIQRWKLNGRL